MGFIDFPAIGPKLRYGFAKHGDEMGDNVKAFIIALGLVVLFFTGSIAGYSTGHSEFWNVTGESAWRLQWEVLLTGLAAIVGGSLAYYGAVKPHADRRQSDAIAFKHRTEEAMGHFKFWTIDRKLWSVICAQGDGHDDTGKFEDMIIQMANTTIEELPDIPNSLTTHELLVKRNRFVSALRLFCRRPVKYGIPRDLSEDYNPDQALEAMDAYVTEIDKPL